MHSRFIYVVSPTRILFLFYGRIVFHRMCILYLFICWWTFGLSPPSGYCEWRSVNTGLQVECLSPCFQLELLTHAVMLCLTFWGTFNLFFTATAPSYIPTSNTGLLQYPCILANSWYFLFFFLMVILVDVNWYLIGVLVCISLMTNDVEHHFMLIGDLCIFFREMFISSFMHIWIRFAF